MAIEEEYPEHDREGLALTALQTAWQETTGLVNKLNRILRGWANYFSVGSVSRAYNSLDVYTATRLRRWLRNKYKVRRRKGGAFPYPHLYGYFGLICLTRYKCSRTCAKV